MLELVKGELSWLEKINIEKSIPRPKQKGDGMAGKKMMAAVQYSKYGEGVAGLKDELLVKVEATGINPADWKLQAGMVKYIMPVKLPFIPGSDISGEIVGVGHGVNGFSEGDKVISWLNLAGGGLAQYAIACPKFTSKRGPKVSAIDGACLQIPGISALQSIRDIVGAKLDGSYSGNILVTAASGGVGVLAVQIAKLTGAHITATCGARNIGLVKSLGADEVLDYKTPEGASMVSPSGKKYDVVIHCAKSLPFSVFQPVLAPKGKVIDLTPTLWGLLASAFKAMTFSKQKIVPLTKICANAQDLGVLIDLVEHNKLKTLVDSQFPLERAEEAWAKSMEGHATGKIVVICD